MNKDEFKTIALIVAAGSSFRTKVYDGSKPKQYFVFKNKSILQYSIEAFSKHKDICGIIVVVGKDDSALYATLPRCNNVLKSVIGASRRQDSVFAGLLAAEEFSPLNILVHDAVRPFVTEQIISNTVEGLQSNDGIVPAVASNDSLGFIQDEYVHSMLDRNAVYLMQTPQGFKFKVLFDLYKKESNGQQVFTDEVSLMRKHNCKVKVIPGSFKNIKITNPQDIQMLQGVLPDLFVE